MEIEQKEKNRRLLLVVALSVTTFITQVATISTFRVSRWWGLVVGASVILWLMVAHSIINK